MNTETLDLARRAVACDGWRWMEGMATTVEIGSFTSTPTTPIWPHHIQYGQMSSRRRFAPRRELDELLNTAGDDE